MKLNNRFKSNKKLSKDFNIFKQIISAYINNIILFNVNGKGILKYINRLKEVAKCFYIEQIKD